MLPPHQKESDTSVEAALSIAKTFKTRKEQVFALLSAGPKTDHELAGELNLLITSLHAARRTLVLEGRIRDSGARKYNLSGRKAVVWEIGYGPTHTTSKADLQMRIEGAIEFLKNFPKQGITDTAIAILEGGANER